MTFATELYRQRKARGLKQTDLARLMGCHKNTICDWELGKTTPKDIRLVAAVEKALGLKFGELGRLILAESEVRA